MTVSASSPLAPPPTPVEIADPKTGMTSWAWVQWFVAARVKINAIGQSIVNIGALTTGGFAVTDGSGGWYSRKLVAGDNISITYPNGVGGDPVISASGGGGNATYVNPQTASYTLQITDIPAASSYKGYITISSAETAQLTIPANATVNFPIGAEIGLAQLGSGAVSFYGASGVTLKGPTITAGGSGASGKAVQVAIDEWVVSGQLTFSQFITYNDAVLADTPIAYWELNDTTGTSAIDSSGNSYNGTYTGTYTLNQASILPNGQGASLQLAGSGYVVLPSVAALSALNHPLSIEVWIKTSTPGTPMYFVGLGSSGSPGLALSTVTTDNLTFGYVDVVNSANSTTALAANTAYHCVVTVDASGNITFYVNGSVAGTGTTGGNTGSGTGAIGTYPNNTSLYLYTGYIQNVAVYNYALTATQVSNHYLAGQ